MEMPLAEKCSENIISNHNRRYLNCKSDNATSNVVAPSSGRGGYLSGRCHMLDPHKAFTSLSFMERLRRKETSSKILRWTNVQIMLGNPNSPTSSIKVGGNLGSSVPGNSGISGLQQFVTRYTIERSDDSGVDVCLESDDVNNPVIEVECGGNKGLLYVTKLCQGSKGQSIFFNEEWLTPNEFQFISGRETAKDWKRSIRHCGKSLKTLMNKKVLQVHQPVCECDYCKGCGPAVAERNTKKPDFASVSHERQRSGQEGMRSEGSTTPSSTESAPPPLPSFSESSTAPSQKTGREGGLNSIISLLHRNKNGSDVTAGNGEEFLDLSIRVPSRTSPTNSNWRKRQRECDHQQEIDADEDSSIPMKRRHSKKEEYLEEEVLKTSKQSNFKNINLTWNTSANDNAQVEDVFHNGNSKSDRRVDDSDNNRACDLSNTKTNNLPFPRHYSNSSNQSITSPYNKPYLDLGENPRSYGSDFNYKDFALFDALKRVISNPVESSSDLKAPVPYSSLSQFFSPVGVSPRLPRNGYINLDSTSPRAFSSRRNDLSSSHGKSKDDPPMMELISPRRQATTRVDTHNDSAFRQRFGFNRYDSHQLEPNKAPVTVLHHRPNQYENTHRGEYQQDSCSSSRSQSFVMPPPSSSPNDKRYRYAEDRNTRGFSANSIGNCAGRAYRSASRNMPISIGEMRQHADTQHRKGLKMLNLQNHAIPMMSLTYSKKAKPVKTEKDRNSNNDTSSQHYPNRTSSDGEIERTSDGLRRLSSSAPPPPPPFSKTFPRYRFCNQDVETNITSVNGRKRLEDIQYEENIFDFPKRRAKSSSPLQMHRCYERTRKSSLSLFGVQSESNSSDSPFDSIVCAQQLEMLRWRDLSCAIESMGEWTVDDVCDFLSEMGCKEYEKVFRKNCIDGDALPLLTENHLIDQMGLKLGHALKVIALVHRRLGNHGALVSDRLWQSRYSAPMVLSCYQHSSSVRTSETDKGSTSANGEKGDHVMQNEGSSPPDNQ